MDYPAKVNIVEVGPRDGLQNEKHAITLDDKLTLINGLSECGFSHIEVASFVSPKWVPQMANSGEVLKSLTRQNDTIYSALTPNLRGFNDAMDAKADSVAVFASASEAFSQANINCSISESIQRFEQVISQSKTHKVPVRAYVSCVVACPYEGKVEPEAVLDVCLTLLEQGCYEVSLGDTIGASGAGSMQKLLNLLLSRIPAEKLALHCHDTYGQALSNVLIGLQNGITTYDSSVAGLGGCPYADGASGNLASEDLIYMLQDMNIETNINLSKLVTIGRNISKTLNRHNQSKVGKALKI